ncbi:MAG: helix-turn-helix domain-containing protein [Lachnospiraceae bacterium]|nr:helix-turn-helix domain-containing protein [Lachnospiraceae bacterium]
MKKSNRELNVYVGTYAHEFRMRNDISQEQMAELLHISTRFYQALEYGRHGMGAQTICRLLILLSEEEQLAFIAEIAKINL